MNPGTPELPKVALVGPTEQLPVAQPAVVTPPELPAPDQPKSIKLFMIVGGVIVLLILAAVGILAA